MKKKLLLILTLIAVVAMAVVGLAACDDENKELNLDGTYVEEKRDAYSITISGEEITYKTASREMKGTFTISDKTLTVIGINDFTKLTINSDNNLVWDAGDSNWTFIKQ